MLDQFNIGTAEAKRQLYVAMIRAKHNLSIHCNGHYLNSIKTGNLQFIDDHEVYLPPSQLAMQLSYKDVWLDYFLSCQNLILRLTSGDLLNVDGEYCCNAKGQPLLRFSKKFTEQIEAMKQKIMCQKPRKSDSLYTGRKEAQNTRLELFYLNFILKE